MKRLGLVLLGLLFFVFVFWVAFARHFPGAALSRMIEAQAQAIPQVEIALSPAKLGWSGVAVDQFRIILPAAAGPDVALTLKNVALPFGFRMFSGLPVRATLGDQGLLELFLPWDGGEMQINGRNVRLEDLPSVTALGSGKVRGGLTFSGTLQIPDRRLNRLPVGTLHGSAEALELHNMEVMGSRLPVLRLDSVEMVVKTGLKVEVEKLAFRGDLQGEVTGFVQPRPARMERSGLDLKIAASFRDSWLRQLGPLRVIVESFLNNGRLDVSLGGTLDAPLLRRGRS